MHRLLITLFITLTLFIGAAGAAPAAHAQVATTTPAASSVVGSTSDTTQPATQSAQQTQDSAYNGIMGKIMTLFAWLVGVAALTLDNAVYYTVVTMGNYVSQLSAVGVAWRILRDIANIILIFGFLAIGISVILDTNVYGYGKTTLPMLLIAAVFLNFSLFITEAVIDGGNLVATQFYTQINGGVPAQPTNSDFLKAIHNEGISNKIMGQLGLQTIYGNAITNPDVFQSSNTWLIGFMGIILFLVTAFVMFSLAFILIARFVILILVIILAPIGFAGYAIPKLSGLSKQWSSELVNQTITAPILLLLLYVALAVITDANFMTGFCGSGTCTKDFLGFVHGNDLTGFASMILSFLVAMGLLLAVVIFSKKLGAFGAAGAMKLAGKATFGATAWAGRNTVGLSSNFLARQARKRGISRIPVFGTNITKALEYGAKSSFDVRGTGVLKKLPYGGVDAGVAQKGGYKEKLKQQVESRTKYAAELKGKEFKDLSPKQQLEIMRQGNKIAELKKNITDEGKAGTLTPERLEDLNKSVEQAEKELDTMHEKAGTERGGKLTYGRRLGNLAIPYIGLPTANVEAAKKIKNEARKTKDDKELDALRKALKKAGGDEGGESKGEEKKEEKPKEAETK
ncbi:MAG: hypothetical protein NTY93_02550 [Candidatus Kaiserbacteria bacterium]|nr:hypothetical protein [Candidatus Kaiserbacteria bacterium]